jgi:NodT family efflux transporter outer membrane factor (OMF) lipoprotein
MEPMLGREWWRLFNDPDLDALMKQAIEANQNLQAAMARVLEARAAAAAVKSQFFPVITLDPAFTRTRIPAPQISSKTKFQQKISTINSAIRSITASLTRIFNPSAGTSTGTSSTTTTGTATGTQAASTAATATPRATTTNRFLTPFDLSYEVDVWGRVRRAYEAAKAQIRFSIDDLEVVRQTLLADLAQNYFNLRSLDSQEQILIRNLELYRDEVDLTQRQFNAGIANETNVLQARVQLESTLAGYQDVRRQRADIEHATAILLGEPPADVSIRVKPLVGTPPVIPAGLPIDLLRRRPDVAEAEQNLIAANAQLGVAKANMLPALTLTGQAGFESVDVQHALNWQQRIWTIGSNVTAPIFEGGLLRANARQARARYAELEATYRNTVLTAFSDVEIALTDLHMRADEAETQARAVDAAKQNLELTLRQYRAGLVNYIQVIIAEQAALNNELAAEQVLNQRMISTVLLIKALGGGWDAESSTSRR